MWYCKYKAPFSNALNNTKDGKCKKMRCNARTKGYGVQVLSEVLLLRQSTKTTVRLSQNSHGCLLLGINMCKGLNMKLPN